MHVFDFEQALHSCAMAISRVIEVLGANMSMIPSLDRMGPPKP